MLWLLLKDRECERERERGGDEAGFRLCLQKEWQL